MKTQIIAFVLLAVMVVSSAGCTNMNKTQQGALSGGAVGAAAGAGIAAIAGGSVGAGLLVGSAAGAIAGGIYGHNEQKKADRKRAQ